MAGPLADIEALFDTVSDLVLAVPSAELRESGRPMRHALVNRAACDRLGYSRAELMALAPPTVIDPLLHEEHARQAQRFLAGEPVAFVTALIARGGERIPVEMHVHRLAVAGHDLSLAVARDLSPQRRLEAEVAGRDTRFRGLLANTLDALALLAADGTVLYQSPSSERISGWSPGELVDRNAFAHVHPDDVPALQRAFAQLIAAPHGTATVTYRFQHRDGGWRWIESLATNRLDDPEVGGVVVSSRDITERRRLDEQLQHAQRMEAVGRLAGGVAHDFNNLLTAMLGYAQQLRERLPAGDAMLRPVDGIERAGARAAAVTRRLLSFSRRQAVEPRVVSLGGVVGGMESLLKRLLGEDLTLSLDIGAGNDAVLIDPGQIEQVVLNLVINARDAMPGGGRLGIATSVGPAEAGDPAPPDGGPPGSWCRLTVSDQGVGMDAAVQARLFEPFFTTKEPGRGTGLGLSMVRDIVQQAGGRIGCVSSPGEGSRFTVLLPSAACTALSEPQEEAELRTPGGCETVLLVEDEDALRDLLASALAKAGYGVLRAADGQRALQRAAAHVEPIHLLVTDVVMPVLGGVGLAAQLRTRHPETRVLFISGYNEDGLGPHNRLPPGTAFLAKPFTPGELLRKMRRVLDRPAPAP